MKKSRWAYIILAIVFLVGVGFLLYPTISNYVNSIHQTRAIASYTETVEAMSSDDSARILENAHAYNSKIKNGKYSLDDSEMSDYMSQLNLGVNAEMGYIEIPDINVMLPIYHTTEEKFLQVGVGHLEWSSLPVGGEGTHCVLSGHRGLPSAMLFTNLDELAEGDTFLLHVLKETLTYEVDQILIVEPEDVLPLKIEKGKDYCTLITCTPYGINTHRLLVRGHRIDNGEVASNQRIVSEAEQVKSILIVPFVAIPLLIVLIVFLIISDHRRKNRVRKEELKELKDLLDEKEKW